MSATTYVDRGESSPEHSLWSAVILQAFTDATSTAKGRSEQVAREHARAWFRGTSADFREVCALAGLDPDAVRDRALLVIADAPLKGLTHRGETLSIAAWSRRLGISPSVIKHRLSAGHPVDVVLSPNRLPNREIRFEHEGESLTVKGWAARTGMAVSTIASRLRAGRSIEEALTDPIDMSRQPHRRGKIHRRRQSGLTATRGVVPNLAEKARDRRGSVAQDAA